MRIFVSLFAFLVTCAFTGLAFSHASNTLLEALRHERVELRTPSGSVDGALLDFDAEGVLLIDSDNNIRDIPREDIEGIRLIRETQPLPDTQVNLHPEHTQVSELAKEPVHDVHPHGALSQSEQRRLLHREIEAQRRRIERTGAPYRISGGILTGVGSLVAFSALTSLAVSGTHHEYYGYYGYSSGGNSRENLRTGAITTAVVGAGITAAGVALIVTANKKRRRAQEAHNQDFSYTLSPHIYHQGAGASLRMQF